MVDTQIRTYEGTGTKRIAQAQVIAALVQGSTLKDAAAGAGVPVDTVNDWKRGDLEFQQLLLETEEDIAKAFIDHAVDRAKVRVKELFPEAVEVFASALKSPDARIRLQAANAIARLGMPREVQVRVGLEGVLRGGDRPAIPAAGD